MHMSKLEKEELLQQAFQQLDTDKSGTISIVSGPPAGCAAHVDSLGVVLCLLPGA